MGAVADEPLDAAARVAFLKQRILVVADVSAEIVQGGAERMLHHHIRALVEAGHQVTVLTRQPHATAELSLDLKDLGVVEQRLPFSGDKGYQGLKQLRQEAKKWWRGRQFDLVVAEQPFVMWCLLQAGCTLPRLQVIHSFAFEEYQTRYALNAGFKHRLAMVMMKKLEKEVYASATKLLLLSRFMQERLNCFFSISPQQSVVVPGAAEEQRDISQSEREQNRRDLDWRQPVVVTLRNLVPRTGVDLMIQVAALMKAKGKDVRWVIMGDGVLRESLMALAEELAVDDVVEFTGFMAEEEVQKRLYAADLFMVPTRGLEGFGLVTLEANACGLPVLATPIAANAELVPSLPLNQLALDASPAALAAKLMWMLEHPLSLAEREALQQQARLQYHWHKHDQRFVELVGGLK